MQELIDFIEDIAPTKMEQLNIIIGGALGAVVGFIFHGLTTAFFWLLIFVAVDYVSGLIQAIHNHNLSSKVGFKGIIKKVIILSVVILFHGLAEIVSMPALDTAVIFAFSLNELFSILENIERAGLGNIIPPGVKQILVIYENKGNSIIDNLKGDKK